MASTLHPMWRRTLAAIAVLLAAAVPWLLLTPNEPAPTLTAPAPPRETVATAIEPAAPAPPAAVAPPAAAVAVDCPHQRLEVTVATQSITSCASATRTRQNGSLRSLSVAAEGTSRWSLRVDTAGGRTVAARLTRRAEGLDPAAEFACTAEACRGFKIGAPDKHGVRLLRLHAAQLAPTRPAPGGPVAETTPVVLQATLQIAPDRQNPALACTTPSVDIVRSDGGTAEFCPAGGAGFEIAPEGLTHFVFHDLEGRRLAVTLGPDGSLQRVAHGSLVCEAGRCGSVSVQVQGERSNPGSQRTFSFSGTTLADPRQPGVSSTLSGQLTMPAQE